jgi:hypothetical protein
MKESQVVRVQNHLNSGRAIDCMLGFKMGIVRLAAVIHILRNNGMDIKGERVSQLDGSRLMVYSRA